VKKLSFASASEDDAREIRASSMNKVPFVVVIDGDDGSHVRASEILLSQRQDDDERRGNDDGARPKDVVPVEVSRHALGRDDVDVEVDG